MEPMVVGNKRWGLKCSVSARPPRGRGGPAGLARRRCERAPVLCLATVALISKFGSAFNILPFEPLMSWNSSESLVFFFTDLGNFLLSLPGHLHPSCTTSLPVYVKRSVYTGISAPRVSNFFCNITWFRGHSFVSLLCFHLCWPIPYFNTIHFVSVMWLYHWGTSKHKTPHSTVCVGTELSHRSTVTDHHDSDMTGQWSGWASVITERCAAHRAGGTQSGYSQRTSPRQWGAVLSKPQSLKYMDIRALQSKHYLYFYQETDKSHHPLMPQRRKVPIQCHLIWWHLILCQSPDKQWSGHPTECDYRQISLSTIPKGDLFKQD